MVLNCILECAWIFIILINIFKHDIKNIFATLAIDSNQLIDAKTHYDL